jgi:hypothetical protein
VKGTRQTAYAAELGDRHYGRTEPLGALPCRCETPNFVVDHLDGEERCWKCGAERPTVL